MGSAYLLPPQINPPPQTLVIRPPVPSLAHAHARRKLIGRQPAKHAQPRLPVQHVGVACRHDDVLRGRGAQQGADDKLAEGEGQGGAGGGKGSVLSLRR